MAALSGELRELESAERKRLKKSAELQAKLVEVEEESAKVNTELANIAKEYKRLGETSVLEDSFEITSGGTVGRINGFRVGRREEERTEWDEVNVGLGHVACLLAALAGKFAFADPVYAVLPRGSLSRVKVLNKKFGLYMESSETEFNMGLISLLEYINNFCKHILASVKSIRSDAEIPRLPEYIKALTIELWGTALTGAQ